MREAAGGRRLSPRRAEIEPRSSQEPGRVLRGDRRRRASAKARGREEEEGPSRVAVRLCAPSRARRSAAVTGQRVRAAHGMKAETETERDEHSRCHVSNYRGNYRVLFGTKFGR